MTVHIGDCTLLRADCLDAMPTLADGSVDCIVTSPPYDAVKEYEGQRDIAAYERFARDWTAEIPRLLSPSGSFWLNVGYTVIGQNETLPLTYLYHRIMPAQMKLVQEIVWHYEGGMSYKRRFTHRTERWQWWAPDPANLYFDLDAVRDKALNRTVDPRNNPLGKNPTDYWYFDRVVSGTGRTAEKTAHPCQFPEAMVERIIKATSPTGGVVFDPFTGSGTTGKMATLHGRKFIGIEKDAAYFDIACDRIRKAHDKPADLFKATG